MPRPPAPLPPGFLADGAPATPTAFQSAVVAVVAGLGPGEVTTYAEVAEEAGHPGAGQAVANVLRRFPGLPWWRVIPSSGRLYRTHAPVQAPLLRSEGIAVHQDRRVCPDVSPGMP